MGGGSVCRSWDGWRIEGIGKFARGRPCSIESNVVIVIAVSDRFA